MKAKTVEVLEESTEKSFMLELAMISQTCNKDTGNKSNKIDKLDFM